MMSFQRRLLGGFFAGFLAFTVFAQGTSAADADFSKAAADFVIDLSNQGIAIVSDKASTEAERAPKFKTLFDRAFDVPAIGKFVLGRYWRTATDTQKAEFLKLFEQMVVQTYTNRFSEYSGEKFQLLGARPDQNSALVSTNVLRPTGGEPIKVEWRVLSEPEGYKVVDVIVEGVSMSVTQQQDFGSLIQRSGDGVDGLIRELKERTSGTKAQD